MLISKKSKCLYEKKNLLEAVTAFYSNHTLLCLFFVLTVITFLVFQDFLLLKKMFLYVDVGSDISIQTYPVMKHIHDYLLTDGYPMWSFNVGLGTNLYASPLSFGDPFISVLLFFDKNALAFGLGYMQAIKCVLGGMIFFMYLRKMRINRDVAFVCAILFAFSGVMVSWEAWIQYSTRLLCVALVLYSIECYLMESKWKLIPISIAILCLSLQGYDSMMYITFSVVYAAVRYIQLHKFKGKEFLAFISKSIGFIAIGVGMAAILILPSTLYGFNSPRISGNLSLMDQLSSTNPFELADPATLIGTFFRTLTIDGLGTGSDFSLYRSYVQSPLFYIGVLQLLVTPHLIFIKNKKERIIYILLLSLCVLYAIFPFVRYAMNGFVSNYYRYSIIMITFILFYIFAQTFHDIVETKRVKPALLCIMLGAVVVLTLSGIYWNNSRGLGMEFSMRIILIACAFLLAYAILGFFSGKKSHSKHLIFLILVVLTAAETGIFAWNTVNNREFMTNDFLTQKISFNDYTNDAVKEIKQNDPQQFYRLEADYQESFKVLTSSLYQKYYGTKSYYTQPKEYIDFLLLMGDGQTPLGMPNVMDKLYDKPNLVFSYNDRVILNTMLGMKYILSKDNTVDYQGYKLIDKVGDVYIHENQNSLGFGFAYDQYVYTDEIQNLSPNLKDLVLMNAVALPKDVVPPDTMKHLDIQEILDQYCIATLSFADIQTNAMSVNDQQKNKLSFTVNENDPWIVFQSNIDLSSAAFRDITFTMTSPEDTTGQLFWQPIDESGFSENNSVRYPIKKGENQYTVSLPGLFLNKLRLDPGNIQGYFEIKNVNMSSITNNLYEQSIADRKEHLFNIKEFSQNDISGTITVPDRQLLFIGTINDKGWKATVDGVETKIITVDGGLIGIFVDAGTHTVRLQYTPPYMIPGAIISLISLSIYIMIVLGLFKKRPLKYEHLDAEL